MSFRVAVLRSLMCVAVGLGFAGFVYARWVRTRRCST
jgi:hypothetical protein